MSKTNKKKISFLNQRFFKKKLSVLIIFVVIIVLMTIGYFIYKTNTKSQSGAADDNKFSLVEDYKKSTEIAKRNGIKAGQDYLDNKLEKATSQKDKADIYKTKASLAISNQGNNNVKEALGYLYESEKNYPTAESALAIAFDEDNAGNTQAAIKYYKIYLERASNLSNTDDYVYYKSRLTKLESGK